MTAPAHVLAAVRSIPHPRQEPDMTAPAPSPAEQCRNVLHIDWDGDPEPVREDIARCALPVGHEKRHEGRDKQGSWFRW